jgi:hypothetical protein
MNKLNYVAFFLIYGLQRVKIMPQNFVLKNAGLSGAAAYGLKIHQSQHC